MRHAPPQQQSHSSGCVLLQSPIPPLAPPARHRGIQQLQVTQGGHPGQRGSGAARLLASGAADNLGSILLAGLRGAHGPFLLTTCHGETAASRLWLRVGC